MKAEDLYQAMAEVKPEYLEESESQIQKRSCKVILHSALIAAVIAAAGCMTALAVTFSLRDSARMDMGISKEAPIPEWTEYEDIGTADTGPEAAEGMPAQAVLTATLCAGTGCAHMWKCRLLTRRWPWFLQTTLTGIMSGTCSGGAVWLHRGCGAGRL